MKNCWPSLLSLNPKHQCCGAHLGESTISNKSPSSLTSIQVTSTTQKFKFLNLDTIDLLWKELRPKGKSEVRCLWYVLLQIWVAPTIIESEEELYAKERKRKWKKGIWFRNSWVGWKLQILHGREKIEYQFASKWPIDQ